MTRNTLLKFLNPVLGLLVVNQILTGLLAGELFKLSPNAFEILHEDGGIVLAILVILHLILNWNWIKATYFKRASKKAGPTVS
jgi:hypothetical protein